MKILKYIPNTLTSVRIALTLVYLHLLFLLNSSNKIYFTAAFVVFLLICLTDIFDGKIARKVKAASSFGALLDVAADFVFIISSLTMLCVYNMIPMWFIAAVLGKFIEFITTSYIIKKHQSNTDSLFIFDYFGRIAAINFFLTPGIVIFMNIGLNVMYINIFIYVTLILVIISSSARVANCYKVLKLKRPIVSCGSTTINKSL